MLTRCLHDAYMMKEITKGVYQVLADHKILGEGEFRVYLGPYLSNKTVFKSVPTQFQLPMKSNASSQWGRGVHESEGKFK